MKYNKVKTFEKINIILKKKKKKNQNVKIFTFDLKILIFEFSITNSYYALLKLSFCRFAFFSPSYSHGSEWLSNSSPD